jgi:hypothetical protein
MVAALAIAAAAPSAHAESYKPYQREAVRAIWKVFGPRYAREAVRVAYCESRLTVSARNGQYKGLFQMGAYERGLFGHGSGAYAQARAAERYFVRSGRDWSPWTCRWAA